MNPPRSDPSEGGRTEQCASEIRFLEEAGFMDVSLQAASQLPPGKRRLAVEQIDLPACREAFGLWNLSGQKIPC